MVKLLKLDEFVCVCVNLHLSISFKFLCICVNHAFMKALLCSLFSPHLTGDERTQGSDALNRTAHVVIFKMVLGWA